MNTKVSINSNLVLLQLSSNLAQTQIFMLHSGSGLAAPVLHCSTCCQMHLLTNVFRHQQSIRSMTKALYNTGSPLFTSLNSKVEASSVWLCKETIKRFGSGAQTSLRIPAENRAEQLGMDEGAQTQPLRTMKQPFLTL